MFTKVVTSLSLMLSTVSAVALSPVAARAQPPAGPPGTPLVQCINNVFGTGIIAKVRWYDPTKVEFTPGKKFDDPLTAVDETIGQIKPIGDRKLEPTREENIAVGQRSCAFGLHGANPPQLAIVTVVGGEYLNEAITISAGTVVGIVGGVACALTAGAACPAAAAAVSGVVSAAGMALPDGKTVFYVGTPGMLEVKGTAWAPVATDKTLGVAQLVYRANIDFCHADLRDTATANDITIDFLARGVSAGRQVVKGSVSDCGALSRGYLETTLSTSMLVDSVRVSTNGGDAMFVDQVRLFRDDTAIVWDGRNNGRGWCLSTDVNDYQGGWENATDRCARSYTFASPAT